MQNTKTKSTEEFNRKKLLFENLIKISDVNITQTDFARNIKTLYASIIDAKALLSEYETELATTLCQSGCITPLHESTKLPLLFYKREDLTCIKAYKIRGALYQMKKILNKNLNTNVKFVAASTGNHALGVLKSAEILHAPNVVICISKSVTDFKRKKLENRVSELREKGLNAQLILFGENFDETNAFAKKMVELEENCFYIDPYNNNNAVAGQGTIGIELLEQLQNKFSKTKDVDKLKELVVVVPIGGGGLISGVSCALKLGLKNFPLLKHLQLKVIGVHLDNLNSRYGDAIKVKTVGSNNCDYLNYFLSDKIKINDCDMQNGIQFVSKDIGATVEGASAGTLKPVLDNLVKPCENTAVVCLLSGGNS